MSLTNLRKLWRMTGDPRFSLFMAGVCASLCISTLFAGQLWWAAVFATLLVVTIHESWTELGDRHRSYITALRLAHAALVNAKNKRLARERGGST